MTDCAFFVYHRKDDNMLETCLNSLHVVRPDVHQIVVTDGVPVDVKNYVVREFNATLIDVPAARMIKRRAACKVEMLAGVVNELPDGDRMLVSDVDVYFKSDPFVAFDEHIGMDLGLTTRGYDYMFPINAGIFYVRINDAMREWSQWHAQEVLQPRWDKYVALRRKYKHEHFGLDWSVGQDFLIANWLNRDEVWVHHGVKIEDVGPRFNFCPPTDLLGAVAFAKIRAAVHDDTTVTLHLKSDLKRLVYERGVFPNALIRHPKGVTAWA